MGPGIATGEGAEGIVTILITDVEGSTALHTVRGDAEARTVLSACDLLVRRQVERHGGRAVKSMGDGVMATFPSPRKAVACALAIQAAVVDQHNDGVGFVHRPRDAGHAHGGHQLGRRLR